MLEKIKSSYFIKIIFAYIAERRKLKLIKYNKSLQQNINISIINYIFFTRKFILYESSKIGKEYDGYYGFLHFKGEYLNGERNGKGKEIWDGRLLFEGEYLHGQRNGKGKEYIPSLKSLLFEGNYLNGKRNGKGKEYYENGKLKFEGEYLNDKELIGIKYKENGDILYKLINTNGNRREYDYYDRLIFEGEYLNGRRNGKGKEYDNDKLIFEGEYLKGQRIQ